MQESMDVPGVKKLHTMHAEKKLVVRFDADHSDSVVFIDVYDEAKTSPPDAEHPIVCLLYRFPQFDGELKPRDVLRTVDCKALDSKAVKLVETMIHLQLVPEMLAQAFHNTSPRCRFCGDVLDLTQGTRWVHRWSRPADDTFVDLLLRLATGTLRFGEFERTVLESKGRTLLLDVSDIVLTCNKEACKLTVRALGKKRYKELQKTDAKQQQHVDGKKLPHSQDGQEESDKKKRSLCRRICVNCCQMHFNSKRCAGCMSVWYCSVECQRADWKARHKQVCASRVAEKDAAE